MTETEKLPPMVSATERAAHYYNVLNLDGVQRQAPPDAEIAMQRLRALFPDGEANHMNAVLFSTSGVHGTYTTIEEIEAGLWKYGDDPEFAGDCDSWPDDYHGNKLTVLVIQPRRVCMLCGNVKVRLEDIPWLRKLRRSSWKAFGEIGAPEET